MSAETWIEKMKKKDDFPLVQADEIIILLVGFIVFFWCKTFLLIFTIAVLIWYWFKLRYYERLIVGKKREIYNVQYDNAQGVTMAFAEGRTAEDRKPMLYDLEQLETLRRFLIDKFVVINLVLLILLGTQS